MSARALHLGIGVVQSVRECLDLLEAIQPVTGDRRRITRAGLRKRLTERLGLGKAASVPES